MSIVLCVVSGFCGQSLVKGRRRSWLICAAFALHLAGCQSGPKPADSSDYAGGVASYRTSKDNQFASLPPCGRGAPEECSPIPPAQKATLLPLRYFPIDESYSVLGSLKVNAERPVYEMPTSSGALRRMQLVGSLEFSLQGQPLSLGAFVEEGSAQISSLFVPFADLTTGSETYPAGRYLDLDPTASGYYTIDFNKAYNPYCAYNKTYECPYPPPSNRLKVEIRAGDKAPRT